MPALIGTAIFALMVSVFSVQLVVGEPVLFGVGSDERGLFSGLIVHERMRRSGASASDPERRAIEIYLARAYAPLAPRAPSFAGALRPFRRAAVDIAVRHPSPSDDELLAAVTLVRPARLDDFNRGSVVSRGATVLMVPALALPVVVLLAAVSMAFAFALRGGAMMKLFGVMLVDAEGREASRMRALWRAGVAWSPLLILYPFADRLVMGVAVGSMATLAFVGTLLLVLLTGVACAIALPQRGLQERLTGTWLVPR